jgi:hypothetical protein
MVAAHKAALLAARPRLEMTPYTLPPGEYIGPNGERVIATTREMIYLDAAGALIKTEPNTPAPRLVNMPMGAVIVDEGTTQPSPNCDASDRSLTWRSLGAKPRRQRMATMPSSKPT